MSPIIEADVARIGVIDAVPKLLEVVCRSTGMGFAAVARVTEDRWVACAVRDQIGFGLEPGGELEIATTICDQIRDTGAAVLIDDVASDDAYRLHPTPAKYGFRSYISVPIRHDGEFFGTLCAIDPQPAKLKGSTALALFELFAELIGAHLAARQRLERSQSDLIDERQTAELREQFIAVLGHDLRNPLASIGAASRLLRKATPEPRAHTLLDALDQSVVRMAGLIDNVLDLARGRLGGGFAVQRQVDGSLADALRQVVAELSLAHPERELRTQIALAHPVHADTRRIAQLVSNLVANALTHGASDTPVTLKAVTRGREFEISVTNTGPPIPRSARAQLFQPFNRSIAGRLKQGLGLGLWISAEIARAHGGVLDVRSDDAETCFSFRMPLEAPAALAPAK